MEEAREQHAVGMEDLFLKNPHEDVFQRTL